MKDDLVPFPQILKVIERIRDCFPNASEICTRGSCVKFAMFLKQNYPQGTILYDLDHAIFQYGKNCYDINGFATKTKNHIPLESYGILQAYDSMNLKYKDEKEI